jgi:phytoene dehydrogenase-like protein
VLEAAEGIGGGTRTSELTLPGLLHDECSAVHALVVGSPVTAELELERHGLAWAWPEVDLSHPFEDGGAAAMLRSIESTAEGLGEAGAAWRRLFGPPARAFDELAGEILVPIAHLPRHPLALAGFGARALLPASAIAKALPTPSARALFAGVAAHSFRPPGSPLSASVGLVLIAACHRNGWPVARGGSAAIAAAMAAVIRENGGTIETGRRVRSLDELPRADVVALDLAPAGVLEVAGERLPPRVARAYRRYRHGPGAFKLDLAVEGGVPWRDEPSRRAGTVHVAGSQGELAIAARDVNRGRMPERPFVLVGQQYLADPSRSRGDVHPVWAYAHVPNGYPGDAGEAILDQVERFAPGLRERILAVHSRGTAELSEHNPNYVGGDIMTGANTPLQMVARPRLAADPYATGIPGVYVCSAATPPGPGAHGMCGYGAALAALRRLR